jgi:putative endonuclease
MFRWQLLCRPHQARCRGTVKRASNGDIPSAYTYKRRPVELVFAEHYDQITDAILAERQIKGWRRAKKEALIRRDYEALPELAKRYGKKRTVE